MNTIVVYSATNSNRLTYVLDWLFGERLQLGYCITHSLQDIENAPYCIGYGQVINNGISIPAAGLLTESDIQNQNPAIGTWGTLPTLFATEGSGCTLPFDMLAAIFYLLSRYEEYYSYTPDKHGRYPAVESILFQQGWLSEPIVDEWVAAFRDLLADTWGIGVPAAGYSFLPTYDIDIAFSHSFKGFGRLAGAYIKALLKGDVQQISERTQVLKKKKTDPYDSFSWLRHLHNDCGYATAPPAGKPLYFILSALKRSAYDRNIHPGHPAMARVIKHLAKDYAMGIHPSYYATSKALLDKEKATLEEITGFKVHQSRQHYIKLKIPDTYHLLASCGITEDYSMGYGTHLGFRAGTGSSFLWYNLESGHATAMRVHPFCFMDTTAHYEQGLTPAQAFEALGTMAAQLKEANSTLVTIFHNFSLGTAREWHGWADAYKHFLAQESAAHKKAVAC